jgi:putative transposase
MRYRRVFIPGGCYFFTVKLADPSSHLLIYHIEQLRCAFADVKRRHPFEIDAIVIMPNHLHCIWTLPQNDFNYSIRWRQIKSHFSRGIPTVESISKAVNANTSAAYNSVAFGNIHYAMSAII